MIELKKCPFCGGDAAIVVREGNPCTFSVYCAGCSAKSGSSLNIMHTIELWNRRVEV